MAKPSPATEWLDLMLGEIDRREQEEREAQKERERRSEHEQRDPATARDQE